jgi:hypothetical protein
LDVEAGFNLHFAKKERNYLNDRLLSLDKKKHSYLLSLTKRSSARLKKIDQAFKGVKNSVGGVHWCSTGGGEATCGTHVSVRHDPPTRRKG